VFQFFIPFPPFFLFGFLLPFAPSVSPLFCLCFFGPCGFHL
jgi:hypothetical protein